MRALRAGLAEVLGLFVTDWWRTGALVLVLVLAAVIGRRVHGGGLGFALAAAVALFLVLSTALDAAARRRRT